MKKFLLLFLIISSTIATAQESVLLRLNYKKGDNYKMQMNQTMNSSAMMMNNTTEMTMEVTDVNQGIFTSEMKITKMVVDMMQGGMPITYDSSKKNEKLDQVGQMMKSQIDPMLKVVITTKSNKFGKNIETKVVPSLPGTEQFKNQSSINYPKNAVRVGDTWTDENEAQGMKTSIEYTITSITADKVTMTATGKITGVGEGTMSGTFEVDRKSGLSTKSTIKNDMKVQGQEMKMSMDITLEKI